MMASPTLAVTSLTTSEEFGFVSSVHQDLKDLDRLVKFFTRKCVQVIVQSRLGKKIKTPSKPLSTGTDRFNVTIEDNPEILRETNRVISLSATSILGQPPLYLEISLKTPEDTLILELWSLSFKQELQKPNVDILDTVYTELGQLLKSIISVTRVIPAYKLSRRMNDSTDYTMHYHIYTTEQPRNLADILGQKYKHVEFETVETPFGGLVFEFSYRTRLVIAPDNSAMMIKSDHYGKPSTPFMAHRLQQQRPLTSSTEQVTSESANTISTPFKPPPRSIIGAFEPDPKDAVKIPDDHNEVESIDNKKVSDDDDSSLPFSNLLKLSVKFQKLQIQDQKTETEMSGSGKDGSNSDKSIDVEGSDLKLESLASASNASSSSGTGDKISNTSTDFTAIDLNPHPFASNHPPSLAVMAAGNTGFFRTEADRVITFFNQVKEAPLNLTSLNFDDDSTRPDVNVYVDVEDELNNFEESVAEYDDFVQKLCN